EKVRAWPDMADSDIASAVLADYGLDASVSATSPAHEETETLVLQRGSDAQLLRELADRNGYLFYLSRQRGDPQATCHFQRLPPPPRRAAGRPPAPLPLRAAPARRLSPARSGHPVRRREQPGVVRPGGQRRPAPGGQRGAGRRQEQGRRQRGQRGLPAPKAG